MQVVSLTVYQQRSFLYAHDAFHAIYRCLTRPVEYARGIKLCFAIKYPAPAGIAVCLIERPAPALATRQAQRCQPALRGMSMMMFTFRQCDLIQTRQIQQGRVDGALVFPGRGERGHGYDPIFVADGHDITFGEMDPDAKDQISHRARAFAKLKAALL